MATCAVYSLLNLNENPAPFLMEISITVKKPPPSKTGWMKKNVMLNIQQIGFHNFLPGSLWRCSLGNLREKPAALQKPF